MPDERPEHILTELVDEVFRLSGAFTTAGDRLADTVGLTSARWLVLGALSDGDGLSVAAIARRRGLSRQGVRESVQRLERDGLVVRTTDPSDARAPLVQLTASGAAALDRIDPARRAWAGEIGAAIGHLDLARMLAELREVRSAVAAPKSG